MVELLSRKANATDAFTEYLLVPADGFSQSVGVFNVDNVLDKRAANNVKVEPAPLYTLEPRGGAFFLLSKRDKLARIGLLNAPKKGEVEVRKTKLLTVVCSVNGQEDTLDVEKSMDEDGAEITINVKHMQWTCKEAPVATFTLLHQGRVVGVLRDTIVDVSREVMNTRVSHAESFRHQAAIAQVMEQRKTPAALSLSNLLTDEEVHRAIAVCALLSNRLLELARLSIH